MFRKWRLARQVPKFQYWLNEVLGPSVVNMAFLSLEKGGVYVLSIETKKGINYYASTEGVTTLNRDICQSLPSFNNKILVAVGNYGMLDYANWRGRERIYPVREN